MCVCAKEFYASTVFTLSFLTHLLHRLCVRREQEEEEERAYGRSTKLLLLLPLIFLITYILAP